MRLNGFLNHSYVEVHLEKQFDVFYIFGRAIGETSYRFEAYTNNIKRK